MSKQQIAIVTGGGRGIGAATAKLLARNGYAVCVNFRANGDAANRVVESVVSDGGHAIPVQADISIESDVVRLFESVDKTLGKITALVNNAGIVLPQSRLVDMSADRVNRMLATNVTGAFMCCREAVKRMQSNQGGNGGAIVNVSSAAARIGSPGEYIDYAASKGAIDTLTRGLALEVAADRIRVNCVRPGFIRTDMHADGGEPDRVDRLVESIPLKRGGEVDDVANAIHWLLSDDASYCTGAFIDVAGGR